MRKGKHKKVNSGKGYMGWFKNPHNEDETVHIVIYDCDRRNDMPHVHLEIGGKTIACIMLEYAEYFDHGYERTSTLSDEMLNMFDLVMTEPSYIYPDVSTYIDCRRTWNMYCGDNGVHIGTYAKKPNYTKTIRRK